MEYTWQDSDNEDRDSQCFGFYEDTVKKKWMKYTVN